MPLWTGRGEEPCPHSRCGIWHGDLENNVILVGCLARGINKADRPHSPEVAAAFALVPAQ